MQSLRDLYKAQGLSDNVSEFFMNAWRSGTTRQYDCYLKQWLFHCHASNVNPLYPTLNFVLEYLLLCFRKGLAYSTLGTIRSALSLIIKFNGKPVGQHDIISTFMRAAAQLRPAHPRNKVTWEINDVLNYCITLYPIDSLSLEQLTKKTLILMAILSGQRGQTLQLLNPNFMTRGDTVVSFRINKDLKTSRPGKHLNEIKFLAYPQDPRICVVTHINNYLDRTNGFRGRVEPEDEQFFVTYGAPHNPASRASIRRWTTDILRDAGIDLSIFKPHSTRGAATSAADIANVPLDTILSTGGWSNPNTFTRFYKLPVVPMSQMQTALLARFSGKN